MSRARVLDKLIRYENDKIRTSLEKDGTKYYLDEVELSKTDIDYLISKGAIFSEGFISIITCPKCNEHALVVLPVCPKCNSNSIDLVELIAHIKCGYIAPSREFKYEDKLYCPNCNSQVNSDELMNYGLVFTCNNCNAKFDIPLIMLKCTSCGMEFKIHDANVKRVPSYSVNKAKIQNLEREFVTSIVIDALQSLGKIETNLTISGISGFPHKVPIMLEVKDQKFGIYTIINENDLAEISSAILDIPKNINIIVLCKEIPESYNTGFNCDNLRNSEKVAVIKYRNITELWEKVRELAKKIESLSTITAIQ